MWRRETANVQTAESASAAAPAVVVIVVVIFEAGSICVTEVRAGEQLPSRGNILPIQYLSCQGMRVLRSCSSSNTLLL